MVRYLEILNSRGPWNDPIQDMTLSVSWLWNILKETKRIQELDEQFGVWIVVTVKVKIKISQYHQVQDYLMLRSSSEQGLPNPWWHIAVKTGREVIVEPCMHLWVRELVLYANAFFNWKPMEGREEWRDVVSFLLLEDKTSSELFWMRSRLWIVELEDSREERVDMHSSWF